MKGPRSFSLAIASRARDPRCAGRRADRRQRVPLPRAVRDDRHSRRLLGRHRRQRRLRRRHPTAHPEQERLRQPHRRRRRRVQHHVEARLHARRRILALEPQVGVPRLRRQQRPADRADHVVRAYPLHGEPQAPSRADRSIDRPARLDSEPVRAVRRRRDRRHALSVQAAGRLRRLQHQRCLPVHLRQRRRRRDWAFVSRRWPVSSTTSRRCSA